MYRILPAPPVDIDPDEAYAAARAPVGTRPWVMVNMIHSADGATAVDGVSGPLGSAGDKDIFGAIRMIPDVILVGAGTAIAEDYAPTSTSVSTRSRRLANGAWPTARIAVVSNSLSFDLDAKLFVSGAVRPIVITSEQSNSDRRGQVESLADVIVAGDTRVDLDLGLQRLADMDARVVLCEGGPTLNGQLLAADLVDEVCVTVAPLIVGRQSRRIVSGPALDPSARMTLNHVLTEDHYLFLRYVVER